ncbi:AI-2E family transporter [Pseudonocardia sulfidoxydans NBRC 16205]|uniref:AI-2E family transporter n=1 Tax=Pseudonocardia sulfidoxydans NBRC 16205 TaxID=1223511 RepID=A0A511DDE6_9PSEU|nr:AI-2E family transporter [Pseudonocardia sulfidoxydans]GEL22393.1 AI-2E family transporter [Pseudonocardia sulfidoxydans NBRC 16205]
MTDARVSHGDAAAPSQPGLPRATAVLLTLAALVVVAAGAAAASWLVAPVFLALVLVIMVHPLHGALVRRGAPRWLATAVLVLAIYAVLVVLAAVIVYSVARLATILPGYAAELNGVVTSTLELLGRFGVGPDQLRSIAAGLDYGRFVQIVTGLLAGLAGLAGNLVFLLSLLLFLGVEAAGAGPRIQAVATRRPHVATALREFATGTRRFLVVTTIVGLVTGVVDAVVLTFLGIPLALLWGVLVFITNYIPYIGFWIGLVPPLLLAILTGGWGSAIVVAVVFLAVNFVLTSVVQPKFVGDAVGLSVSLTLVGLVFWAWLLGPLGAVLAVPLTLLAKVLLVDADPRAHWLDALVGSRPPAPPPEPTASPD